jgi:hypothetical protein
MLPTLAKTLYSGAPVGESGFYRVKHSAGHRRDAECFLPAGLVLPTCSVARCDVSYIVTLPGPYIVREADISENRA